MFMSEAELNELREHYPVLSNPVFGNMAEFFAVNVRDADSAYDPNDPRSAGPQIHCKLHNVGMIIHVHRPTVDEETQQDPMSHQWRDRTLVSGAFHLFDHLVQPVNAKHRKFVGPLIDGGEIELERGEVTDLTLEARAGDTPSEPGMLLLSGAIEKALFDRMFGKPPLVSLKLVVGVDFYEESRQGQPPLTRPGILGADLNQQLPAKLQFLRCGR